MAKRAVCVGINEFLDSGAPPLRGCVNDARNMAQILVREFGFEQGDVRVVVNQQGTRAGFLAALDWLVAGARPGDELVLFTSSHGSHIPDQSGDEGDGMDEVLVTHDHDWERQILSDDDLAEHFARVPRGATMVCLWDTCHSGSMQDTDSTHYKSVARPTARLAAGVEMVASKFMAPPAGWPSVQRARARGLRSKGGIRAKGPGAPCVSVSACADEETAADAKFGGVYAGAFTHCMLECLRETPGDVTWEDLHARTVRKVQAQGFRQTPQLHVPDGIARRPIFGGRVRGRAAPPTSDLASLDRRIGDLETQGQWVEAIRLLQQRVALVADPAEKVRTLEHVVSVYRVKLGDEHAAVRATEQLVAIVPGHDGARAYLLDAYARLGQTGKLDALRRQQLPSAPQARAVAPAAPAHAQPPQPPQPDLLGTVGAGLVGALGGIFNAVTTAPAAYQHPGAPQAQPPTQPQPQHRAPPRPQAAAPQQAPAPQASARKCPYCRADLAAGARACGACGASV